MIEIDKLIRSRNRITLLTAITFAIWQGGQIMTRLMNPEMAGYGFTVIANTAGALAFVAAALMTYMLQRRVKKERIAETLNDEWTEHVRAKAFQFGFSALMVSTILLYIASIYVQLPAQSALQSLIVVGVVSTIFAFVWVEHKGGTGQ